MGRNVLVEGKPPVVDVTVYNERGLEVLEGRTYRLAAETEDLAAQLLAALQAHGCTVVPWTSATYTTQS